MVYVTDPQGSSFLLKYIKKITLHVHYLQLKNESKV